MKRATITDIIRWLDQTLQPENYQDLGLNGLQVQSPGADEVLKIAFAVDAGISVIEKAVQGGAQLLIVHHGLFWGQQQPIVGPLAQKIDLLLKNNCCLYASHLPLDGHIQLGNAAQFLEFLGASSIEPFFRYKGMPIGAQGVFETPRSILEIRERCKSIDGYTSDLMLEFGPSKIRTLGILTGSGSLAIEESKRTGLDLLISGEAKQEAFHEAKDRQCNVLFVGHYASETFGVQAIERSLKKEFSVETTFISMPTGI